MFITRGIVSVTRMYFIVRVLFGTRAVSSRIYFRVYPKIVLRFCDVQLDVSSFWPIRFDDFLGGGVPVFIREHDCPCVKV